MWLTDHNNQSRVIPCIRSEITNKAEISVKTENLKWQRNLIYHFCRSGIIEPSHYKTRLWRFVTMQDSNWPAQLESRNFGPCTG